MAVFKQIAPNLFISDNPSFGDYDPNIVYNLLISVDANFSSCLELNPFSSCDCNIQYKSEEPRCCNLHSDHLIYLSATQNHWAQWVYQFAHEYCHHLINGDMINSISGLIWFEETICELSSMYHLHAIYTQWKKSINQTYSYNAPLFLDYLNDLLTKNPQLISATRQPGFLSLWEKILFEPEHHRDHYNAIAARMFPLFVENPSLWKIILRFGDMRKWDSLSGLFEHLHQTADDSYAQSLSQLENLLLS